MIEKRARPIISNGAEKMDLQEIYGQAVEFHQRGNLVEAERRYLQILATDPSSFAPNYMLGIIRAQQDRNIEALGLIGTALKAQPNAPAALLFHGKLLATLGRFQEAVTSYDRALALKPNHAEALCNRGPRPCGLNAVLRKPW